MYILIIMIVLLINIVVRIMIKDFKSPVMWFSCLWFLVLGLYSLRLYGLYEITEKTQMVLCLGILNVLIGYYVCQRFKSNKEERNITKELQYDRLMIVFAIIVLSSLYFYIPNIQALIKMGSVNAIKKMLVTGELEFGGVWMQYIVRPFQYIIITVASYFVVNDRRKKLAVFLGVIVVLFAYLGAGSKTHVLYFAMCIVVAVLHIKRTKNVSISGKRIGLIVSAVIIILLMIIMGIKSIYFYICGCIPLLDKVINDDFYIPDGFHSGFVSFNSCIRLVIKGASVFGINIESELFEKANSCIRRYEYTAYIAPNGRFNAFHTMFGDFYVDYGMVGVVVLSMLFGVVLGMFYKRFVEQRLISDYVICCLLMYYIIFGVVRFQLSHTVCGLALIYALLLLKPIIYKKIKWGDRYI